MVRSRCLKPFDLIDAIGSITGTALSLVAMAVVLVILIVIEAVAELHKRRWLGPIVLGTLLAWVAIAASACSTAPRLDPRDPEIFRPAAPVYPLPER